MLNLGLGRGGLCPPRGSVRSPVLLRILDSAGI
jgi:hypothetical protein